MPRSEYDFGTRIQQFRQECDLTQRHLAAQVGISPTYLNDIEHGRRKSPPDHLVYRLAHALNVPTDYLLVLAGLIPDDIDVFDVAPEQVKAAMDAFRAALSVHADEERG